MKKKLVSLILVLCLLPLGALAEIEVVASLFPQFDFARTIAGERAHVSQLLPPGQDSHGYEPSMRELLALGEADLFLFTGEAMEPWAASLVGGAQEGLTVVDVSAGITAESGHELANEEHSHDAHIWLNPLNAIAMCENIRDALITADPEGEAVYRAAFACESPAGTYYDYGIAGEQIAFDIPGYAVLEVVYNGAARPLAGLTFGEDCSLSGTAEAIRYALRYRLGEGRFLEEDAPGWYTVERAPELPGALSCEQSPRLSLRKSYPPRIARVSDPSPDNR